MDPPTKEINGGGITHRHGSILSCADVVHEIGTWYNAGNNRRNHNRERDREQTGGFSVIQTIGIIFFLGVAALVLVGALSADGEAWSKRCKKQLTLDGLLTANKLGAKNRPEFFEALTTIKKRHPKRGKLAPVDALDTPKSTAETTFSAGFISRSEKKEISRLDDQLSLHQEEELILSGSPPAKSGISISALPPSPAATGFPAQTKMNETSSFRVESSDRHHLVKDQFFAEHVRGQIKQLDPWDRQWAEGAAVLLGMFAPRTSAVFEALVGDAVNIGEQNPSRSM